VNAVALSRRFIALSKPRFDGGSWAMIAFVACVSAVVITLPVIVLWLSFREASPVETFSAYSFLHYIEVFGDPFILRVMGDTLLFSLVALVVAFAFGLPIAWLLERTDLSGKSILYTLMTLGLLMPGFAVAMGWLFLLHPRIGIVNRLAMDLFDLTEAPFNIASVTGMGWVLGLSLAPLAFIMTAAVLRAVDPVLEESAYVSGAGFVQVLRKITLPLAWPGILAAGIYIFTIGFAAFDVPAIIGWSNKIFTFSTFLVLQLVRDEGLPRYGAVAALSTVVMGIAAILIWWYSHLQAQSHRFQVVTGKGYRPRLIPLGRHAWKAWSFLGLYFALSNLLPLLVIIWASLLPYFRYPSAAAFRTMSLRQFQNIPWDQTVGGLKNTAVLMLLTPTLTLVIAVAFSWVVLRSKVPGRSAFDFVAFLPHAVPNIVFGFAALLFTLFVLKNTVPIHGTIWILLLVFVIARLSYATRMTNSTMIQIHKDLEEAATMSGVSTLVVLRRVVVPLIAPTLVYAWLWIALLTFRELTLAVILSTGDNLTLPIVVWNSWIAGGFGAAAALTLVLSALMIPLVGLYWWGARKTGLREA
jgi:iron(III) transport system permease protein